MRISKYSPHFKSCASREHCCGLRLRYRCHSSSFFQIIWIITTMDEVLSTCKASGAVRSGWITISTGTHFNKTKHNSTFQCSIGDILEELALSSTRVADHAHVDVAADACLLHGLLMDATQPAENSTNRCHAQPIQPPHDSAFLRSKCKSYRPKGGSMRFLNSPI